MDTVVIVMSTCLFWALALGVWPSSNTLYSAKYINASFIHSVLEWILF